LPFITSFATVACSLVLEHGEVTAIYDHITLIPGFLFKVF